MKGHFGSLKSGAKSDKASVMKAAHETGNKTNISTTGPSSMKSGARVGKAGGGPLSGASSTSSRPGCKYD